MTTQFLVMMWIFTVHKYLMTALREREIAGPILPSVHTGLNLKWPISQQNKCDILAGSDFNKGQLCVCIEIQLFTEWLRSQFNHVDVFYVF